jgi:hypothetical protein
LRRLLGYLLRPKDRLPLDKLRERGVWRTAGTALTARMVDDGGGDDVPGAALGSAGPAAEERGMLSEAMSAVVSVGESALSAVDSSVVTYGILVTRAAVDPGGARHTPVAPWRITRRYNDWKALHLALLRESPKAAALAASGGATGLAPLAQAAAAAASSSELPRRGASRRLHALPPLPPKKMLGNLERDFVEARRRKLGEWLDAALAHPIFGDSHELRVFLEAHADPPVAGGGAGGGPGALRFSAEALPLGLRLSAIAGPLLTPTPTPTPSPANAGIRVGQDDAGVEDEPEAAASEEVGAAQDGALSRALAGFRAYLLLV